MELFGDFNPRKLAVTGINDRPEIRLDPVYYGRVDVKVLNADPLFLNTGIPNAGVILNHQNVLPSPRPSGSLTTFNALTPANGIVTFNIPIPVMGQTTYSGYDLLPINIENFFTAPSTRIPITLDKDNPVTLQYNLAPYIFGGVSVVVVKEGTSPPEPIPDARVKIIAADGIESGRIISSTSGVRTDSQGSVLVGGVRLNDPDHPFQTSRNIKVYVDNVPRFRTARVDGSVSTSFTSNVTVPLPRDAFGYMFFNSLGP